MKFCENISHRLFSVTYFLTFLLSLLVYYFRSNPYIRPTSYFVLLSIAAGLLFLQILRINDVPSVGDTFLLGFEILLIPLSYTLTQQALYITVMSRDPWTHWALISQIIHQTHIPPYNAIKTPYVYLPNFHLFIISGMLISGIRYKWTSYLAVGLPTEILLMLVIYMFSINIFQSKKLGLISVFFVGISDNVLDMAGRNIVPNSIGVSLMMLIVYFVHSSWIQSEKGSIKRMVIVYTLVMSLSFFHTLSYGMLVMSILVIHLITIHNKYHSQRKKMSMFIGITLIIAMFTWGLWAGVYLKSLVMLVEALIRGISPGGYSSKLTIPITYVISSRIGMVIYATFVGIGILVLLPSIIKEKRMNTLIIATLTLIFWSIGVFAFLNPGWAGIAHRFWYVGEVFGSIVLGLLILKYERMGNITLSSMIIPLAVSLLAFLMFTASVSNDDNPLVSQYSTRTGWYDSEVVAGSFVLEFMHDPIASDWDYIMNLNNLKWTEIKNLSHVPPKYGDIGWVINSWFPKSFQEALNNSDEVFILRKCLISKYSFWLGPRWGMLRYPPLNSNVEETLSKGNFVKDVVYSSDCVYIWR